MSRFLFALSGVVVVSSAFWLSGCGASSSTPDSNPSASGEDSKKGDEHAGHDAAEIAKELAKLSDEDRKLAETQKVCPVAGGPLGAMGPPIKVDVKGQPVFICCDNCEDAIKKDPDKYLAKLKTK